MTPEQRLDRAERILVRMAQSGRRSRSEFRYKINSLIDAQIKHDARFQAHTEEFDREMRELAAIQRENSEQIASLIASQSKADQETAELKKSLQNFIDRQNSGSST